MKNEINNGQTGNGNEQGNANGIATNAEYEELRKADCVAFSMPLHEAVAPGCFIIFLQLVNQDKRAIRLKYNSDNGMLLLSAFKPNKRDCYNNDGPATLLKGSTFAEHGACPIPCTASNDPDAVEIARAWLSGSEIVSSLRYNVFSNGQAWGKALAFLADSAAKALNVSKGQDITSALHEIEASFYRECSEQANDPNA